jgi:hypothetical protein
VKRYGRILVPIGWLVLMPLPILAFYWAGLIKISRSHGTLISHGALHDTTAPGVWAGLAVVYLVWIVALAVGSIWALDHLGYHYQAYDRPKRPTRRERRRQRAGLGYQAARQQASRDALAEIARASRKAAREVEEAGATRGGDTPNARGGGADEPRKRTSDAAGGGAKGGAADEASDGPGHDAADEGGHERK